MDSFPEAPRLVRGGIVTIDPDTSRVKRVIVLQYNPDTLSRTLQVKGAGSEGSDKSDALRLKGPPIETIKLEAEIDGMDQTELSLDTSPNIQPQLAALEILVYPESARLQKNFDQSQSGGFEVMPLEAPFTIFVWSSLRVLPVRITDFSITEEAFDPMLNPLRAKVSLGMRVLTTDDLRFDHKGASLFMAYLRQKESLAIKNQFNLGSLNVTGIL